MHPGALMGQLLAALPTRRDTLWSVFRGKLSGGWIITAARRHILTLWALKPLWKFEDGRLTWCSVFRGKLAQM
jgi:hypothetical protein